MIDEYTRECLSLRTGYSLKADDVMDVLTDLFIKRGIPDHIRSDNGSEFTAKSIRTWLPKLGIKTLYIEPGSPWENGYNESFNGRLRDECLNGETFYTLKEAQFCSNSGGIITITSALTPVWAINHRHLWPA